MRHRRLRDQACGRALGIALLATLLLGLPSAAAAQSTGLGNPLSPGIPQGQAPSSTSATSPALPTSSTTSTSGATGLSGGSAIVIAIGALVILGGISLFIWRDARRRAPVRARAGGPGGGPGDPRRTGSKQRAKPRKLSAAERRRRKRGRAR